MDLISIIVTVVATVDFRKGITATTNDDARRNEAFCDLMIAVLCSLFLWLHVVCDDTYDVERNTGIARATACVFLYFFAVRKSPGLRDSDRGAFVFICFLPIAFGIAEILLLFWDIYLR